MMDDNLGEMLLDRAKAARAEGTATALGDAWHFEEAAKRIAHLSNTLLHVISERDATFALMLGRAERSEAEARRLGDMIPLMVRARAAMRACGWHLAPASEPSGDGTLELAVAEIEAEFADILGDDNGH